MKKLNVVFAAFIMIAFTGNSFAADVSGDQYGTWTVANSPYIVKGNVTVPEDSVLNVEAGVTVKFDGYYNITIRGTIVADGTSSDNITFTSNKGTPASGDWQCLYFRNTTSSILNYCIIEYGGSWGDANVFIGDYFNSFTGMCTITNSIIRKSSYGGFRIENHSQPVISNNTITDNNSYGIYMQQSVEGEISDNTISDNGAFAISMDVTCSPDIYNNDASGNTRDAVEIRGGTTMENCLWKNNLPYIINVNTIISSGDTLTIEPGVTVKFGPRNLRVNGTLIADGTLNDTIIFTSKESVPAAGDWQCIMFTDSSSGSIMDYCIVEYGGGWGGANLVIGDAGETDMTLTNSIIRKSDVDGIKVSYNATPVITNNLITENYYIGIYCTQSGNPTINFNDIINNGTYGVYVSGTFTVNAENNWWGDSTGPAGVGPGIGDSVSTYVDYDPWLKNPAVAVEENSTRQKDGGQALKTQNSKLTVSPNPFTQQTAISKSSMVNGNKIRIYDVSGKLIEQTDNLIIGKNLKPGIYFIKIGNHKPLKITKIK